ncbi:hypothetical protein DAPPUDRAFT_124931, partial [Daphnia pulex]
HVQRLAELGIAVAGRGGAADQVVVEVDLAEAHQRLAAAYAVPPVAGEGHMQAAGVAPGPARVAIADQGQLAVAAEVAGGDGDVVRAAHDVQAAVVAGVAGQRVGCVAVADRHMVDPDVLAAGDGQAVGIGVAAVLGVDVPGCVYGEVAQDDVARPGRVGFRVLALGHPLLEVGLGIAGGRECGLLADQDLRAGEARRPALGIIDADQGGVGRDGQRAAVLLVEVAGVLLEHGVAIAPAEVDMADDADDLGLILRLANRRQQLLPVENRVDATRRRGRAAGDQHPALA